ncbi:hypothetical protein CH063_14572 [Colletotrichum higginsianum]|uniref:Uncharacterized protein n=1 Tax=Colletotrichum higginsianum (strain IMI 349063) TaxID=759273 RepID=H1VZ55_COLHI|nr:hypothetical protein CH063_14572 [Colletotrichum higginsianum]
MVHGVVFWIRGRRAGVGVVPRPLGGGLSVGGAVAGASGGIVGGTGIGVWGLGAGSWGVDGGYRIERRDRFCGCVFVRGAVGVDVWWADAGGIGGRIGVSRGREAS